MMNNSSQFPDQTVKRFPTKNILLAAGGCQIKIGEGGITITSPSTVNYKASQHVFGSGATVSTKIPNIPSPADPSKLHILSFDVRHKLGEMLGTAVPYSLIDSKGNVTTGTVPSDGIIRAHSTELPEKYTVVIHDEVEGHVAGDGK